MTLTLTVLRCPERVAPETRQIEGGELSIGRAPDNDWVLPDPERDLSKHHCVLAYRSGGWQILDLSANGTFLNRDREPVGRDQSRPLNDGDRLGLGPYEIEVRIAETPAFASRRRAPTLSLPTHLRLGPVSSLIHCSCPTGEGNPFAQAEAPASINLPPDYDPLALDPAEVPMAGPTMADHSPHLDDALRPPRVVLPEDWDRDFVAASPATPPAAAPPVARPLSAKTVLELQPGPITPPPAPAPAAPLPDRGPAAPPPGGNLPAAFLRGAGLEECAVDDPEVAMEQLGAAFVCSSRDCDKRSWRAAPSRANFGSRARQFSARATIRSNSRPMTMMHSSRWLGPAAAPIWVRPTLWPRRCATSGCTNWRRSEPCNPPCEHCSPNSIPRSCAMRPSIAASTFSRCKKRRTPGTRTRRFMLVSPRRYRIISTASLAKLLRKPTNGPWRKPFGQTNVMSAKAGGGNRRAHGKRRSVLAYLPASLAQCEMPT